MRPIITLLVDDEEPSLRRTERLLALQEAFVVFKSCSDAKTALNVLENEHIDLLLLDIEMPGMSGLDLLSKLDENKRPLVVFVTAYDEYAITAFDYYAIDYILKPFSNERFNKMTERVKKLLALDQKQTVHWPDIRNAIDEQKIPSGKIAVKTGKKYHFIEPNEIAYICADGNYCEIWLQTGIRHVHRDTIVHLLTILPEDKFMRIHHSYIVSVSCIRQVCRHSFGELEVRMNDNRLLKVSRKYKGSVKKLIKK